MESLNEKEKWAQGKSLPSISKTWKSEKDYRFDRKRMTKIEREK